MKLDLHILFNQVHMDNELTSKKKGITEIYVRVCVCVLGKTERKFNLV